MKKQVVLSISIDACPEIQCIPLDDHIPGLGLNPHGVTWQEQADALLYMDSHDELVIKNPGHAMITLERLGRSYRVPQDNPVRILAGDRIRIGMETQHTFDICHIYRTTRRLPQIGRLSKLAMLACATAILSTCCLACSRSAQENPAQSPYQTDATTSASCEGIQNPSELTEEDMKLYLPQPMGMIAPSIEDLEREDVLRHEPDAFESLNNTSDSELIP